MRIRKARLSDAEDLARLYLQFWEVHGDVDPLLKLARKPILKREAEQARKDIRKKGTHIFVAVEEGHAIGFIELLIKKNHPVFSIKKYGYLNSCVVDKRYRRKGVAQKLVRYGIAFLKKKGARHMKTNVYASNKAALKAWEKVGFKEISKIMLKRL